MIINPSAHTMIPRRNTFRPHAGYRRRQAITLPGGKRLWFGGAEVLLASVLFLSVSSSLLNGSTERVSGEIASLQVAHEELVTANIVLRAKKARMFSSEAVEMVAGRQLAIHIPASGQYRKF